MCFSVFHRSGHTRKCWCDRDSHHKGSRLVSFTLLFNLCPKTHQKPKHTHSKQQVMMTTASDLSTKKPHKQPFMINVTLVAHGQYNADIQMMQQRDVR